MCRTVLTHMQLLVWCPYVCCVHLDFPWFNVQIWGWNCRIGSPACMLYLFLAEYSSRYRTGAGPYIPFFVIILHTLRHHITSSAALHLPRDNSSIQACHSLNRSLLTTLTPPLPPSLPTDRKVHVKQQDEHDIRSITLSQPLPAP